MRTALLIITLIISLSASAQEWARIDRTKIRYASLALDGENRMVFLKNSVAIVFPDSVGKDFISLFLGMESNFTSVIQVSRPHLKELLPEDMLAFTDRKNIKAIYWFSGREVTKGDGKENWILHNVTSMDGGCRIQLSIRRTPQLSVISKILLLVLDLGCEI